MCFKRRTEKDGSLVSRWIKKVHQNKYVIFETNDIISNNQLCLKQSLKTKTKGNETVGFSLCCIRKMGKMEMDLFIYKKSKTHLFLLSIISKLISLFVNIVVLLKKMSFHRCTIFGAKLLHFGH